MFTPRFSGRTSQPTGSFLPISSHRCEKEAATRFPFSGHFPLQPLADLPSFFQPSHGRHQDPYRERGFPQLGTKHFLEQSTASHARSSSAPPPDSENGPSSPPAASRLASYRGCFTSIFIFCFGVRSPCRMTAITQRSSILRKYKVHPTSVPLCSRIATRK